MPSARTSPASWATAVAANSGSSSGFGALYAGALVPIFCGGHSPRFACRRKGTVRKACRFVVSPSRCAGPRSCWPRSTATPGYRCALLKRKKEVCRCCSWIEGRDQVDGQCARRLEAAGAMDPSWRARMRDGHSRRMETFKRPGQRCDGLLRFLIHSFGRHDLPSFFVTIEDYRKGVVAAGGRAQEVEMNGHAQGTPEY
jgi:hypothetical protein